MPGKQKHSVKTQENFILSSIVKYLKLEPYAICSNATLRRMAMCLNVVMLRQGHRGE